MFMCEYAIECKGLEEYQALQQVIHFRLYVGASRVGRDWSS